MERFVHSCACRGRKPTSLHLTHCRLRLGLMSKMIRERDTIRFLCAPHRFGKSAAAFGYADAIFRLKDVVWIPANDPRFLRDLDQEALGDYLLEASPRPGLLVLDDLPYLHVERCDKLSRALELITSHGWETVVTAVPSCDMSEMLSVPTRRFGVVDLMLTEEELTADNNPAASFLEGRNSCASRTVLDRISGLAWASPEERSGFLSRVLEEEMPSEILFAHISLLVLRSGNLSALTHLQRKESPSILSLLSELYPYLGIDIQAGTFDTAPFPLEDVLRAVESRTVRAVSTVRGLETSEWALQLADYLLTRGDPVRACRTVQKLCKPHERAGWLARRCHELTCEACILPAHELAESARRTQATVDAILRADGAWRLLWLGQAERAQAEADLVARDSEADEHARLVASALLARARKDDPRALDAILRFAGFGVQDLPSALRSAERSCREMAARLKSGAANEREYRDAVVRWSALCCAVAHRGGIEGVMLTKEQAEAALGTDMPDRGKIACILADIALDAGARLRQAGGLSRRAREAVEELRPLARRALAQAAHDGPCDLFALQLADKAAISLTELAADGFPASFLDSLRRIRESMAEQRRRFEEAQGVTAPCRTVALPLRPDERIPHLRLRLFGGMDASVGERRVDPKLFRRRKVQTVAGILAIARGKEVSIDYLEDSLWPTSVSMRARNNFYNAWSILKKAFELSPKECPYLVRLQNSCRIEASLVETDVYEFLELCDRMQFSIPDSTTLPALFGRIETLYAGDLLPNETSHPTIIAYRKELKNRLVDALVAASVRAREARELPVSLQAARTALRYDEGREDAYNALIKAQAAAGQRSSAMATFFQCRSYLSENLGIDPSPQTTALYQRLLIDEAPVGEQLSLPL